MRMQANPKPHIRLGCSTISFRHLALDNALAQIAALGFQTIDLGALPGVCDHVPYVLDAWAVNTVAVTVTASRLRVRSINGDIGDLNRPLDAVGRAARDRHLEALLTLAATIGAQALVLPCGALSHSPLRSLDDDLYLVAAELTAAAATAHDHGVELWTESLHYHRLCWNTERAQALTDRLAESRVGVVMDFSHVVASGGDPLDLWIASPITSRTCTSATPYPATSTCPSDAEASASPGASRRWPMSAMPASSPWNWKPATSPTSSGRRPPPKPHN
jgi:sugar phosphate isomerase/epimerase